MTDIQQWRRKIQPTRTRTPASLTLPTPDIEELDDLQPPTPKRRLKPKLSAYFNQTSKPATFAEDLPESHFPKWPFDQMYPDPKPEDELDAVVCHLMADPYGYLGPHFNASLMRIFESYLTMMKENVHLKLRCDEGVTTAQAVIAKLHMAERDWEDEKNDYKEEVKRLEVLLSKASRRGVAEVTLARQESKVHGMYPAGAQKRETIFEFLEKITKRHEDTATWSNQRATMKPLLQSQSNQDINMSQRLSQKKSMTNIHADLPFGTPPAKDMRFSLTNMSIMAKQAATHRRNRPADGSNATDDTFSTFSSAGDLLPDEGSTHCIPEDEFCVDHDMADIEHIAIALARRRGVAPSLVMPQLITLFAANPDGAADRACSMPTVLSVSVEPQSASVTVNSRAGIVKRATVMTRASGFFQKLRPQLTVDPVANSLDSSRRFSFEPGDDIAAHHAASPGFVVSPGDQRVLRKSASLCSMSSRNPSRIPTPVSTPGTVVRPRRERDESSSSLLTVIKRSEDGDSRTSSVYSSPSVYREEFNRTSPSKDRDSMSGLSLRKSNLLLDHTNNLRGNASRDGVANNEKRSSALSISQSCDAPPDMSRAQQENFCPADTSEQSTP